MADTSSEILRQDALTRRLKGVEGGNRVAWSAKDRAMIRDYVMAMEPDKIIRAARPPEVKASVSSTDMVSLAKMGIEVRSDIGADDLPVFIITTPRTDLVNDSVNTANVETADFEKNPPVLDGHDSSKPPVAVSTRPWLSGDKMLAIPKFPKPGVSANSDQIAAAVRARLLRGASIGFIPLKWSFSKDPARPLGVDFHSIKLLEWSICSLPCNPDCLLVGAVSAGTSSDPKTAALRLEARALVATARAIAASISGPLPKTREQRIAEVRALRRAAGI
jgi:hypothetical protein